MEVPISACRRKTQGSYYLGPSLGKATVCIPPQSPQRLQINIWFIQTRCYNISSLEALSAPGTMSDRNTSQGEDGNSTLGKDRRPHGIRVWLLISSHLVEQAFNSHSTHQHSKKHVLAYGFKGPERCLGKLSLAMWRACLYRGLQPPSSHSLTSQGRTEYQETDVGVWAREAGLCLSGSFVEVGDRRNCGLTPTLTAHSSPSTSDHLP